MKDGVSFTDCADDASFLEVNFWSDNFLVLVVKLTKPVLLIDALRRANEVAGWTLQVGKGSTVKVSENETLPSLSKLLKESVDPWPG